MCLLDTIIDNASNVVVSLTCDDGFCIIIQFFFTGNNIFFDMCDDIL